MADLPPPNTKRWVVRRKAAVVAAVRSGGITIEEACRIYQLTEEELLSWERAFEVHGLPGLRATRVQQYRRNSSSESPSRRRQTRELNFEALAMGYLLCGFSYQPSWGEPLGRFQTSVGL